MSRPTHTKTSGILWIVILLSIVAFVLLKIRTPKNIAETELNKRDIVISGHELSVYEARTQIEREMGLSAFDHIKDNEGMLFYFDNYGKPSFWMKGMKFPIDIVWMKDWIVKGIVENVPVEPEDKLTNYVPDSDINEVLELKAGIVSQNNIKIGDALQLK